MPSSVDVFWSFRSPYSYLAAPRLLKIATSYDIDLRFRPVLPMAIRMPERFANPAAITYIRHDAQRVAEFLGVDFSYPDPDPLVFEVGTLRAASEQPYIHRLTRLGVAAVAQTRGLVFAEEISRLIWNGKTKGWDRGHHLAEATGRAGLELPQLETAVAADEPGHDQVIAANGAALEEAGHWGVPTCVFEGEPFFGQDRLDVLCWRLDQRGLKRP